MKGINLNSDYNFLTEEDKKPAQNMDFDTWSFGIQNSVQELYDKVLVNGEATFEQKAKLDFIFTYIGEVCRQGESLIEKK